MVVLEYRWNNGYAFKTTETTACLDGVVATSIGNQAGAVIKKMKKQKDMDLVRVAEDTDGGDIKG